MGRISGNQAEIPAALWRSVIGTTSIGVNARHTREFRIDRPQGSGDWVLIHFPTPMRLRDRHGIKETHADACILYAPDDPHWFQAAGSTLVNHYVHLHGADLAELIARLGLPVNEVFYPRPADFLPLQLEELRNEWASGDPHSALVFSAMAVRLLACLARHMAGTDGDAPPRQDPVDERLRWFRKRIQTHPHLVWSVSGLARLAGLSPAYFSTTWRRQFGVSPQDDLIQARLDRACQLLANSELSITRVAQACGFADPLYFSRLFRKRIGRSPRDFARQLAPLGRPRRRH
jgi:AraC-like DNA-binding protein